MLLVVSLCVICVKRSPGFFCFFVCFFVCLLFFFFFNDTATTEIYTLSLHDALPISHEIPEGDRDYYLERRYPAFGNLVPRDVASRNAKTMTDEGRGVGETGLAVYLDFQDAIRTQGQAAITAKYGNLFDMYQRITGENPYQVPMRIYPAVHYTMGGLWVDYHLMSTIPGLFVLGEANFSDHGANRLGASALMQGLADGYFVIPQTLGAYLASTSLATVTTDDDAFQAAEQAAQIRLTQLLKIQGEKTVMTFHRELGRLVWDHVGMSRDRTR